MSASPAASSAPVLVLGATSGTGIHVVEELLARGVAVRVAARDVAKARARFGERVTVVPFDLTRPGEEMVAAFRGVAHAIVCAAVPKGRASEELLRATELDGLVAAARAAREAGLAGRFVYLTTLGVYESSWLGSLLDTVKWNMLAVRREAEAALREVGLDLCIVRAGMLSDAAPGLHPLRLWRGDSPLVVWRGGLTPGLTGWIARADVARVLVEALDAPAVDDVSVEWAGAAGEPASLGAYALERGAAATERGGAAVG